MLENKLESVAMQILQELNYHVQSYLRLLAEDYVSELILANDLKDRLSLLNPAIPIDSIEEAVRVLRLAQ